MKKSNVPALPKNVPEKPTDETQKESKEYYSRSELPEIVHKYVQGEAIPNVMRLTMEQVEVYEAYVKASGTRQDNMDRKDFGIKSFWLSAGWIAGIFVLLLMDGLKVSWLTFELPEKVILAAIGSTTINVLGTFYLVMKYHFNPKKST